LFSIIFLLKNKVLIINKIYHPKITLKISYSDFWCRDCSRARTLKKKLEKRRSRRKRRREDAKCKTIIVCGHRRSTAEAYQPSNHNQTFVTLAGQVITRPIRPPLVLQLPRRDGPTPGRNTSRRKRRKWRTAAKATSRRTPTSVRTHFPVPCTRLDHQ
jgi:hypothetical protein